MDAKDEICSLINTISGEYSPYQVFYDFVQLSALAISNSLEMFHNKIWQEREDRYIEVMKKYSKDNQMRLSECFLLLFQAFEDEISDILGEIYMKSGAGNAKLGQFFTPYHVSKMTARLALEGRMDDEVISVNEPSCGAGGMIIAMADVLKEEGLNYQGIMRVVAQDLDWLAVHMCYIQLSILGINAIVVQGDTLLDPFSPSSYNAMHIFRTPRNKGALL